MNALGLGAALAAGLAGSAHCAVMCGSVATALGASSAHRRMDRATGLALTFNLGRLAGYALVGAALQFCVQTLGTSVPGARWGLVVRALAAVWMAALAVRLLAGKDVLGVGRLGAWCWRHLAPLAAPMMRLPQPQRSMALGLLWGFMPCGLVYSVLLVAASSSSVAGAAAIMVAFGLGTLPALVGVGTASALGFAGLRGALGLSRVAGVVVLACGLLTGWGALSAVVGPQHYLGMTFCDGADGLP